MRDDIKEKGLSEEEVYDHATWKGKKERIKRRWLDRVRDDIKEKGLSGEEVYDRATWKRKKERIKEEMVGQSEG